VPVPDPLTGEPVTSVFCDRRAVEFQVLQDAGGRDIQQSIVAYRSPLTRTRNILEEYGLRERLPGNVIATSLPGYPDMLSAMVHARKILTDSGGVAEGGLPVGGAVYHVARHDRVGKGGRGRVERAGGD